MNHNEDDTIRLAISSNQNQTTLNLLTFFFLTFLIFVSAVTNRMAAIRIVRSRMKVTKAV